MEIKDIGTITDALAIVPFETEVGKKESRYSMNTKDRLEWINSMLNGFSYILGGEFRFFAGYKDGAMTCYAICLFVGSKIRYFTKVTVYRLYGSDEDTKLLLDKITERAKELNIRTISIELDSMTEGKQLTDSGFKPAKVIYERRIK